MKFLFLLTASLYATQDLQFQYDFHCLCESDINEHLPLLESLASECSSVAEMGVKEMVSTWALLQGLSKSPAPIRTYLGVDIYFPPPDTLSLAYKLAKESGIDFSFLKGSSLEIELFPVDLLFIDTLHTYCQLTQELENFSRIVRKYIALHDTGDPWGIADEPNYTSSTDCPAWIDRNRRGLWPAVEDFLLRHPEWTLKERRHNNHGFTVLIRTGSQK